jgi:hypothetical protein
MREKGANLIEALKVVRSEGNQIARLVEDHVESEIVDDLWQALWNGVLGNVSRRHFDVRNSFTL